MEKKKCFLAGGGGFLGTNILNFLSKSHEIITIDRGSHFDEIKSYLPGNITFLKGDLDTWELEHILSDVSVILHCAGPSRIKLDNDYNGEYWNSTLRISRKLSQAAQKISCIKKIIYFSSYLVYENIHKNISGFVEETPVCCQNIYGMCHLANETEIMRHTEKYLILRLSTVYGPYAFMRKIQTGGVLGLFIKKSFEEREITIHGKGTQTMDFLYINDFLHILDSLLSRNEIVKDIINVGSGSKISVAELAGMIRNIFSEKMDIPVQISNRSTRKSNLPFQNPIKKLINDFGIKPNTPLEEGLWRTILSFKSYEESPIF